MSLIRDYFLSNLISPLKQYPTIIQRTMIEIIIQKLERLYDYSWKFPEIITPNKDRMDILRAIADQFVFTIRNDADIEEQVAILDHILYLYSKRGSIDTIENMWKYYGGKLPKDVTVKIPSYDLFRYNISKLSGTHTFVNDIMSSVLLDTPAPEDIYSSSLVNVAGTDRFISTPGIKKGSTTVELANTLNLNVGDILNVANVYRGKILRVDSSLSIESNRPGIMEIKLTNNTYPIEDLRKFLIDELVAAGTEFYFINEVGMNLTDDILNQENPYLYKYDVITDSVLYIQSFISRRASLSNKGYIWSGYGKLSEKGLDTSTLFSGKGFVYFELVPYLDIGNIDFSKYMPYENYSFTLDIIDNAIIARYDKYIPYYEYTYSIDELLYCTPMNSSLFTSRYLYNSQGEEELITSKYPGYFILSESLLGEEVI